MTEREDRGPFWIPPKRTVEEPCDLRMGGTVAQERGIIISDWEELVIFLLRASDSLSGTLHSKDPTGTISEETTKCPKGEVVSWASAITIFRLGLCRQEEVSWLLPLYSSLFPSHLQLCTPRGKLEGSRDRGEQGVEGERSQHFPASLAISWLKLEKKSFKMDKNMELNGYDSGMDS